MVEGKEKHRERDMEKNTEIHRRLLDFLGSKKKRKKKKRYTDRCRAAPALFKHYSLRHNFSTTCGDTPELLLYKT